MPDRRTHRGPAPDDAQSFGAAALPRLREAAEHLCWLLSRGYAVDSSLALVGNRFDLVKRQREAVRRATCAEDEARARRSKRVAPPLGDELWIDGHNVLTTVEAALAGGVLLVCQDGAYRDMASMHGSWRRVDETQPAIDAIVACLRDAGVSRVRWLLDRPVSNSGRLRDRIRASCDGLTEPSIDVELVDDPDRELVSAPHPVASADSGVLDRCRAWYALANDVVHRACADAWFVDLTRRA